jgi:hypothetical protein
MIMILEESVISETPLSKNIAGVLHGEMNTMIEGRKYGCM